MEWSRVEWSGGEEWSGVEWRSGMGCRMSRMMLNDWSGVEWSWSGVECSAVQCSGVEEWNGLWNE